MILHPIKPVFNPESRILILGSFPSVKSREQEFFYGHPQNRFWKVVSSVLGCSLPESIEEKKAMLLKSHIAVWDVIKSCEITGSSDSSIKDVVPNDICEILKSSNIHTIYCNGATAFSLFEKHIKNNLSKDFPLISNAVLLPSTSPANAAWSLENLCGAWKRILVSLSRADFSTRFYSLNNYAADFYGKKLYRLSLDGGFTCPNRDGTIATGGCIFCDAGGAGDFSGEITDSTKSQPVSVSRQLAFQKALISGKLPKNKEVKYIAYFQAFTGTYAPIGRLRELYSQAVSDPDVEILSIATRPDCLSADVLNLLKEFNQIKPVWVELGLQTIHKKSADYIRRGYELKVYNDAVKNLQKIGITQIITHIIIGLPGENTKMCLETLYHAIKTGSNGIKLQLLHVLKNTDLAKDYEAGKFKTLSREEYMEIINECLKLLPADVVVHRLNGDGNRKNLIAPLWSTDKKKNIIQP